MPPDVISSCRGLRHAWSVCGVAATATGPQTLLTSSLQPTWRTPGILRPCCCADGGRGDGGGASAGRPVARQRLWRARWQLRLLRQQAQQREPRHDGREPERRGLPGADRQVRRQRLEAGCACTTLRSLHHGLLTLLPLGDLCPVACPPSCQHPHPHQPQAQSCPIHLCPCAL